MTIKFLVKGDFPTKPVDHHYRPATFRTSLYVRIRDGKEIDQMRRASILVYPQWWDATRERIRPHSACPEAERLAVDAAVSKLRDHLMFAYLSTRSKGLVGRNWLKEELRRYSNPMKEARTLEEISRQFLADYNPSEARRPQYENMFRILLRFERFARLANGCSANYMTASFLDRLYDYILNENDHIREHPELLRQGEAMPALRPRSRNTVNDIFRKLRTFSYWCVARGFIERSPFDEYKISRELYGTPVCLTGEEVARVYHHHFKSAKLVVQKDIFVFQCNVGCRVSDMMRLQPSDCKDGQLSYIPSKTILTNARTVTVPLNRTALEIIERYKGGERLLPYISVQNYNVAIKKILREAGVTRQVVVLDPLTRKERRVSVCDVASSHMARRTFINTLYRKVKDPSLIASLTGHSDGSRAFQRYRAIDDKIKEELVRMLEV